MSPDGATIDENPRESAQARNPLKEQGFGSEDFHDLNEEARGGVYLPRGDTTEEPPSSPVAGTTAEPTRINVSDASIHHQDHCLPEVARELEVPGQGEDQENIRPAPSRTTSTPSHKSYAKIVGSVSRTSTPTLPMMSSLAIDLQDSPVLQRRSSNASQASNSTSRGGKGKGRATSAAAPDGRPAIGAPADWPIGPEGSWYSAPNAPSVPPSAWKPLHKGDQTKKGEQMRKGG